MTGPIGFSLARRESTWGLLFLAPWLIGFVLFFAGPMLASLAASFTDLILVRPDQTHFVGLENWQRLLGDQLVIKSLLVTGNFLLIAVPVALALPLLMAGLLNSTHLVAKPLFRALFFLPVLIPGVAAAIIWQGVLNPHTGWLDLALVALNVPAPDWLNDPQWVIPALSLISTWSVGNAMVILLAGLQGVPSELYDAAKVDGANALYRFFKITIPMISPVIFYNLVLGIIGALQSFTLFFIMTKGGPNNDTLTYMLYLYNIAFEHQRMGYGSAMAWLLFVYLILLTLIVFRSSSRWVFYEAPKG